jgi:hypothetical protein
MLKNELSMGKLYGHREREREQQDAVHVVSKESR